MTDDIVVFLRERLDEDQQVALAAIEGASWSREPHSGCWRDAANGCDWGIVDDTTGGVIVFDEGAPDGAQAAHIARHDPARVLRDVDAKRTSLAIAAVMVADLPLPDDTPAKAAHLEAIAHEVERKQGETWLRLLAAPYSDHLSYRQEWAP